jgi:hypothetical protein
MILKINKSLKSNFAKSSNRCSKHSASDGEAFLISAAGLACL